jgi:hypothetical protein
VAALLGLGLTMLAETIVELVEYPIVYGSTAKAFDYYDTIADIGMTLVGAVVGSLTSWIRRSSGRW